MLEGVRPCPICQQELSQSLADGLSTWECPDGHGVGVVLAEAYRRLQRDELQEIERRLPEAPHSELLSPLNGEPMVTVTFPVDVDTHSRHQTMAKDMTIEVDPTNMFGWFAPEELQAMPRDESGRAAAGPGLIGLDQLDEEMDTNGQVFDGLTEADYAAGEDGRQEGGVEGFLQRLADRLKR